MATRKHTQFIIIHSSASRPSQDIGRDAIDAIHRARGFLGIGYHFVIRRNGALEKGRPQEEIGAHTLNYNSNGVGICLVGGVTEKNVKVPENNFTPEQWATLLTLVQELKTQYPAASVIGHRDTAATACPSFDAKAWAKEHNL